MENPIRESLKNFRNTEKVDSKYTNSFPVCFTKRMRKIISLTGETSQIICLKWKNAYIYVSRVSSLRNFKAIIRRKKH